LEILDVGVEGLLLLSELQGGLSTVVVMGLEALFGAFGRCGTGS
jgi:hypothetical protein